jgi:plasmid stabilization system protein ParE
MGTEFLFTRQAAGEYENITKYLALKLKSPQAARNFEQAFLRAISAVCVQPESFPLSKQPEVAQKGYRVIMVNKYLILYVYQDNKIIIAHIFHQSQDYAKLV